MLKFTELLELNKSERAKVLQDAQIDEIEEWIMSGTKLVILLIEIRYPTKALKEDKKVLIELFDTLAQKRNALPI